MAHILSERLLSLMEAESVSKRRLSRESNVERKSIIGILAGKSYPRYDSLIKIANFFEISVDYLLGLSDDCYSTYASEISVEEVSSVFIQRLLGILKEKGYSEYKLAKMLHIGQTTVSKWTRGHSMPEVPLIAEIAKVLNCSADYLLGRIIKQE